MAAVVVPILAALEPVIAPLVIQLIDKAFPPRTGSTKFTTAVSWFESLFAGLAKVNPATAVPDQPTISGWVQSLVDGLNKAGALKGPATVIPTTTGGLDNAISVLNWLKSSPIPIGGV